VCASMEWSASTPIRNQSSLPLAVVMAPRGNCFPKNELASSPKKEITRSKRQHIRLYTARSSQADVSVSEGGLVVYSVKSGAVETGKLCTVQFMLHPNCRLESRGASEECCRAD
jgi:hypothetical protein